MPKRKSRDKPKQKSGNSVGEAASESALKKLTVKQLRARLKKEGLDTKGLKAVLVQRLLAFLLNEEKSRDGGITVNKSEALDNSNWDTAKNESLLPASEVPLKKKQKASESSATDDMKQPQASEALSATQVNRGFRFDGSKIETDRSLTVSELMSDQLFACARQYWRTDSDGQKPKRRILNNDLIAHLYEAELNCGCPQYSRIMALDSLGYFDQYLWPMYKVGFATDAHALSMMIMFNFRISSGVPLFPALFLNGNNSGLVSDVAEEVTSSKPLSKWQSFCDHLLQLNLDLFGKDTNIASARLVFFAHCIHLAPTNDVVRSAAQNICCLDTWSGALSQQAVEAELCKNPEYQERWQYASSHIRPEFKNFVPMVAAEIADILCSDTHNIDESVQQPSTIVYCIEALRLLVALLSWGQTRPFLIPILSDMVFAPRLKVALTKRPNSVLGSCAIDKHSALAKLAYSAISANNTDNDVKTRRHISVQRFEKLQSIAFRVRENNSTLDQNSNRHRCLSQVALSSFRKGAKPSFLGKCLKDCERSILMTFVCELGLSSSDTISKLELDDNVLIEMLQCFVNGHYNSSTENFEDLATMPPHPTSGDDIWNEQVVPSGSMGSPALPQMRYTYRSFSSYLAQSLALNRLDFAASIRNEITSALSTLSAIQIDHVSAISHRQPAIGAILPQNVLIDVNISMDSVPDHKKIDLERDVHIGDAFVLLQVSSVGGVSKYKAGSSNSNYDVEQVNVATLVDILDKEGTSAFRKKRNIQLSGNRRTLRLSLSPAQYHQDLQIGKEYAMRKASALNTIFRGSSKLTAKANLIDGLSSIQCDRSGVSDMIRLRQFPRWLAKTLLGARSFGNNESPDKYDKALEPQPHEYFDCFNLFANQAHLEMTFGSTLRIQTFEDESDEEDEATEEGRAAPRFFKIYPSDDGTVKVIPYQLNSSHEQKIPRPQKIRLTASQGRAIVGALKTETTVLIEGGPGTGKSTVACCLASILARHGGASSQHERVLVIGNSSSRVNHILFKLSQELGVDRRFLVRLGRKGHGPGKFGPAGTREYCLDRRKLLLQEVSRLSVSLGVTSPESLSKGKLDFTCETADHFYKVHIGPRIRAFHESVEINGGAHDPFVSYFNGKAAVDEDDASSRFAYLRSIFLELHDYRALELMQNHRKQMDYLTCQLARVVVVSSDYLVSAHKQLSKLGFFGTFDSVIVDGAEHITDAKIFLALYFICCAGTGVSSGSSETMRMKATNLTSSSTRLSRLVMLGDPRTGFPQVENDTLGDGCHLRMSLFSRLMSIQSMMQTSPNESRIQKFSLFYQWRQRPILADLHRWHYEGLEDGNLKDFRKSNPGFAEVCQFVDVSPLDSIGEVMVSAVAKSEEDRLCDTGDPRGVSAGYQNLAEAEYIVAVYQFMRLIGYPAKRVSILATHESQCDLIKDVLNLRCVSSPAYFGRPHSVCTALDYAGQENDIILLSLTRTSNIKGLLATRRLLLAVSRAKLGLYIFGSSHTFFDCFRLTPLFTQLKDGPTKLQLVVGQGYGNGGRNSVEYQGSKFAVQNVFHMVSIVRQMLGAPLLKDVSVKS